ncbi:MAG: sigma-54-dependent Fis family transcriptional regulator [Bacteroidetes bacterium]|nr:sigma-54-dependent Fis family transcriptional regulator [Bacteroidota bacterium]
MKDALPVTRERRLQTESTEILVVDDEEMILFVLSHLLRVHGFTSRTAMRGDEALRMFQEQRPDLVIMDIRMPGLSGFEVLDAIREADAHIPVILMTALSGVRDAVAAMKAGAFDYIAKPFENDEMIATVRRALDAAGEPSAQPPVAIPEKAELHSLFASMGKSPAIGRLARECQQLAERDTPILITGEIGVGKRMLGRILHGIRECSGPFLNVDCTGASEELLRIELFGTSDEVGQKGKLHLAAGGTLLLDEVTEIPLLYQDILVEDLRPAVLRRPGHDDASPAPAKLLFTASLEAESGYNEETLTRGFRELYGDAVLVIPPLRDRREDIPSLAIDFLKEANTELGRELTGFSDAALEMLVAYHWPGNAHQLKSVIRRATLIADQCIDVSNIELPLPKQRSASDGPLPQPAEGSVSLKDQVKRHISVLEKQMLADTLKRTGWNKAQASRILGITYKTLLKKVNEHGLESKKSL